MLNLFLKFESHPSDPPKLSIFSRSANWKAFRRIIPPVRVWWCNSAFETQRLSASSSVGNLAKRLRLILAWVDLGSIDNQYDLFLSIFETVDSPIPNLWARVSWVKPFCLRRQSSAFSAVVSVIRLAFSIGLPVFFSFCFLFSEYVGCSSLPVI